MQQITLTKVIRYTTNKDGTPLVTKDGRPYTRVTIKAQEYGDKFISGFGNKDNASWKEGDRVEAIVEQKGEYLNFSTPKKEDATNEKLQEILNAIVRLKIQLEVIKDAVVPKARATAQYNDFPDVVSPDEMPEF